MRAEVFGNHLIGCVTYRLQARIPVCSAISIIVGKPGNALTLTLSRRERGFVIHPLKEEAGNAPGFPIHAQGYPRLRARGLQPPVPAAMSKESVLPRHWKTSAQPFINVEGHISIVVSQQHPAHFRCPFKHYRVWNSAQINVLSANNDCGGFLPQNSSDNLRSEALVCQKASLRIKPFP